MSTSGVTVGRGVGSRVLAGGSLSLLVATSELAAAQVGLARATDRLADLNASDVGDQEGRGPSYVADPIPVPGGLLWSLDTSGMPKRELRALPELVVQSLVEAGVQEGQLSLPAKVDYTPFRDLALTPGLAMSVVAYGLRAWDDPRGAARPQAWAPLLDVGLAWLADGRGEDLPLVAVTGGGGPYALGGRPDDLPTLIGGQLSAGGGMELLRRGEDGVRYVRLAAILRPELSATWFPEDQSVAGLTQVSALTDRLERVADSVTWAAADVKPGRGTSTEGLINYSSAPMIMSELPRNGFLVVLREDVVPGAFPWQLLNPERRARLADPVSGAVEERISAGRSLLRFGTLADWMPGPGRAAIRDAARRAMEPAFG